MPRYRHRCGSTYQLIGIGKMQTNDWLERFACPRAQGDSMRSVDMAKVVVYRSEDNGSIWVRPWEEFNDGRFEHIPADEPKP